MKNKIYGLILLSILVVSFSITSGIATSEPTTDKKNDTTLKKELDGSFLKVLGLQSNITIIDSAVVVSGNLLKTNSVGYDYNGKFSSGNLTYLVHSGLQQTKNGKLVTTKETNTISGSLNMSCTQQTSNKTLAGITTTTRTLNAQIRNSSGTYNLNIDSEMLTSTDTANLISFSVQIDQNLFDPIGKSTTSIQEGATGKEMTIRFPDGNEITTNMNQGLPGQELVTADKVQTEIHGEYTADSIIPGINDHGTEIIYDTRGDLELWCMRMWWLPSWEIFGQLYALVANGILGLLAAPLGVWTGAIVMGIIASAQVIAAIESNWFMARIDPYDVKIEYTDIELKSYNLGGLIIKFPYCFEIGFYTNRVSYDYGNTYEYTGWYYYPVDTLCWGHLQSVYSMVIWKHADAWSLDPPEFSTLSILCYDESSSNFLGNIPLSLNNQLVPSGSCISIPEQQYTITAPDAGGAFHYLNIGGTAYGNSPTIYVSADTTIIVNYYWIPTFTVTLYALDCYFQNQEYANVWVDGNYVGGTTLNVQLPLGYHTFQFDDWSWDPYWGSIYFSYILDAAYNQYSNGASIPIYSNTYIAAYY